MDSKIIVGAVGLLVVGAGVFVYSNNQQEKALMEQTMAEEENMMAEEEMMEDEAMMDDDGNVMEEADAVVAAGQGSYGPYDESKLAMAETGNVVLFFKASWCPSCRALDADIKASLSDIPADLTILEVDFDQSAELRQKYGVTTQHTLVQVDQSGNQITKWSGGSTLEDLVSKI